MLDFIDDFQDREGMAPTVYEIADYFGVKTSTVFAHLKALQRKNQISRTSKARSIAVNRKKNSSVPHMSFVLSIPLLGRINAGLPSDSPAVAEGEFPVSSKYADLVQNGALFALKVNGESMRDLGMLDGDIVIVRKDCPVKNGDVVVALVNNETTVKSYFQKNSTGELHPANPDYKVQVYAANEVALQGKVIALHREF